MRTTFAIVLFIGLAIIDNSGGHAAKTAGYVKTVEQLKPSLPTAPVKPGYVRPKEETVKAPIYGETSASAKPTESPTKYVIKATTSPTITPTTLSYGKPKATEKEKTKKTTATRYKREISSPELNDLQAGPASCKPCKEKKTRCVYGFEKGKDGCPTCNCANPCQEIECADGLKCHLIQIDCIKTPCQASLLRLCLPRQFAPQNIKYPHNL